MSIRTSQYDPTKNHRHVDNIGDLAAEVMVSNYVEHMRVVVYCGAVFVREEFVSGCPPIDLVAVEKPHQLTDLYLEPKKTKSELQIFLSSALKTAFDCRDRITPWSSDRFACRTTDGRIVSWVYTVHPRQNYRGVYRDVRSFDSLYHEMCYASTYPGKRTIYYGRFIFVLAEYVSGTEVFTAERINGIYDSIEEQDRPRRPLSSYSARIGVSLMIRRLLLERDEADRGDGVAVTGTLFLTRLDKVVVPWVYVLLPQTNGGHPFRKSLQASESPENGAFGYHPCPVSCKSCFYREGKEADCAIHEHPAKKFFGSSANEFLPTMLGDLPRGPYCPNWTHPSTE